MFPQKNQEKPKSETSTTSAAVIDPLGWYPKKNQAKSKSEDKSKTETSTSGTAVIDPLGWYPKKRKEDEKPAKSPKGPIRIPPLLEVKAGYFNFTDSKMRKVFDQGGLDIQLSGSYPIWKWLQLYASLEIIHKKGRSLRGHRRTHFYEYPASLGLRAVAPMSRRTEYYLSLGPRYVYVHVHNNSPYVDREVNHSSAGGFVNTGFNFFPVKNFVIDIFGEYSYCRMNFHAHKHHVYGEDRQVGGYVFGGGLGYAF